MSIDFDVTPRDTLPQAPKSSVAGLPGRKRTPSESDDDYPRIVVMLDPKTRVIAADIQWILQRRVNGTRWQGQYFFRSKAGLLLYAPKPIAPELLALPDWFPEHNKTKELA